MIYGTPSIHIEDDSTDRVGIRSLVLSQMWQPARWPMTIDEFDAAAPAIPEVPAGMLFIGKQDRQRGGARRRFWHFEGINGDGKSVTFKDRAHSIDYVFEPGFSEKSILLLPKIQALMTQYGGYVIDGQVIWPPTVPDAAGSGMKKPTDAGGVNPMFGRDTFLAVEGTYLFRYMSLTPPSQAGVGKIHGVGSLPGVAAQYPDRDYLMLPVKYQRRGPAYENLEGYWLSGAGGWPKVIYGNGSSVTATDGLGDLSNGTVGGFDSLAPL